MKVVIIGAGEVGFHVAKALSEENYDITVVDIDPEKCQRASESLDVILPELLNKIVGTSVRVPVTNVSMIDLVFNSKKKVSVDQINDAMKKISSGSLKGVLNVSDQPLVSIDYNHNPASSTFDLTQTEVIDGRLGRVLSWYDNEWGFANRMSDTASVIGKLI